MPKVYSPELGDYVEIPEKPMRIISLSPSVTETLFYLDAGDRVVGVDAWSYRPREALNKKRVGSYTYINIDIIKSLDPDLILTATGVQRNIIEMLRREGFTIYPIPVPTSIYQIFDNILLVAGLIGEYEKGLDLVEKIIDKLKDLVQKYKFKDPLKTYIEIDLGGPTIPGYFSHITSALHIFNLRNIFGDRKQAYLYGFEIPGYKALDLSEVAKLNPDLIIYESKNKKPSEEEFREIIEKRGWQNIKAVASRKYVLIPNDTLAHYGPSFIDNLEFVIKKILEIF